MSIHILNYVKATQKLPEIFAITSEVGVAVVQREQINSWIK
ncbi:MAG: hypothetical protein V3S65_10680 [Candidatus Aminicenantaceae bacterium]